MIGYVHGIPYNGMSIEVDTFHYCCIMYTMIGMYMEYPMMVCLLKWIHSIIVALCIP